MLLIEAKSEKSIFHFRISCRATSHVVLLNLEFNFFEHPLQIFDIHGDRG
jgi:hypothetical protein